MIRKPVFVCLCFFKCSKFERTPVLDISVALSIHDRLDLVDAKICEQGLVEAACPGLHVGFV